MTKLNDLDKVLHRFMIQYQLKHSQPITLADASDALTMHKRSVHWRISKLYRLGYIQLVMPSCYKRRYLAIKEIV